MLSDPFKSDYTKMITLRLRINFEKEKYFVRNIFRRKVYRKAGAPDGVEALVGEVVHQVDVKGYDMPMSIYSQHFSSLL